MKRLTPSILLLAIWILTVPLTSHADTMEAKYSIGFAHSTTADPMGGEMKYAIWYPSHTPEQTIKRGPFTFPGTVNAEPASGSFGLVVISHGTEGTYLGHHNIAAALARNGIIAVAVLHPRDNFQDSTGTGHRIVWEGRPRQISAVINAMLTEQRWQSRINKNKIGAFGFSLGGYTVLSLLGAGHDLRTLITHCQEHQDTDPVCRLRGGLDTALQTVYQNEYLGKSPIVDATDKRISAAVLADPLAAVFSAQELAGLADIPLRIYLPEYGDELAGEYNGKKVLNSMLKQSRNHQPTLKLVPKAKHLSFLVPFPESVARTIPGLLDHAEGFDCQGFQSQFAEEVAQFFVAEWQR